MHLLRKDKRDDCDVAGLFSFTIGWAPSKQEAPGNEEQLLLLHCHYKSMTNWKWTNKYTDKICKGKLILKKQLRTIG